MNILTRTRTTLLLNWHKNPYHAPILAAHALDYFGDEGLKVALLEPDDPSDVTELVGTAAVDFGLKAMIHTAAARAKGYPVISLATLLDEPPTGFIFLKSSGIKTFNDFTGKRIGYVGEFGKKMLDDLAAAAGVTNYTAVRVGMNVVDAILTGVIDTGIGFSNFQLVQLATYGEVGMIRIDELAGLGCCCFCSVQLIANESIVNADKSRTEAIVRAIHRGARLVAEEPVKAWEVLQPKVPLFKQQAHWHDVFVRSLPFFTRNMLNVERDWAKVGTYARHLGVADANFDVTQCYTNAYIPTAPATTGTKAVLNALA